jgi:hypothetical protein
MTTKLENFQEPSVSHNSSASIDSNDDSNSIATFQNLNNQNEMNNRSMSPSPSTLTFISRDFTLRTGGTSKEDSRRNDHYGEVDDKSELSSQENDGDNNESKGGGGGNELTSLTTQVTIENHSMIPAVFSFSQPQQPILDDSSLKIRSSNLLELNEIEILGTAGSVDPQDLQHATPLSLKEEKNNAMISASASSSRRQDDHHNNNNISCSNINENYYCQICFDSFPKTSSNAYELTKCNHFFCKDCLISFLKLKIEEGQVYPKCFFMTEIHTKPGDLSHPLVRSTSERDDGSRFIIKDDDGGSSSRMDVEAGGVEHKDDRLSSRSSSYYHTHHRQYEFNSPQISPIRGSEASSSSSANGSPMVNSSNPPPSSLFTPHRPFTSILPPASPPSSLAEVPSTSSLPTLTAYETIDVQTIYNHTCNIEISAIDIQTLLKDNSELLKKYHNFKFCRENKNARECPSCHTYQLGFPEISTQMICLHCTTKYCYYHSNAHNFDLYSTCQEYDASIAKQNKENEDYILSFSKPCPSCGLMVSKTGKNLFL